MYTHLYDMGSFLQDKLLANYFAFERTFAGLGFVGTGVALAQTNAQAGGASLLFAFLGYMELIIILPLLAFMSGANPLNRAYIKGAIYAIMAILAFAALVTGVLTYLIAAGFFSLTSILYLLEVKIGSLTANHASVGANMDAHKESLFSANSWKRNPISRDVQFY